MRRVEYFPIRGGEDLSQPALTIGPGRLLFGINYECDEHGRPRRVDGYERLDGRPSPSAAMYWLLSFKAGVVEPQPGETITGPTGSGELLEAVVTSGAWPGAAGFFVLIGVSGTFAADDELLVGGKIAEAAGQADEQGGNYVALTNADNAKWLQAATEAARAKIEAVPGDGPVRGVWEYREAIYAFRDDGARCRMYRASGAGWTQIDLGRTLAFGSGATAIKEEDVITGATSGATATVKRVVVTENVWGDGAEGYLVVTEQTGAFQAENLTVGGSVMAVATGNAAETTLDAGGRFEFVNYNFYALADTLRMYGCDGVNPAFEFDGAVFAPIKIAMATAPAHICAHKHHLFLSFPGGSVQHSALGEPLDWSALLGAAEIGIGAEITGFSSMPNVLGIWSRDRINLLYGTGVINWELRLLTETSGAVAGSLQPPGVFLASGGISLLAPVQEYGDFGALAISDDIKPYLSGKKKVTASLLARSKGHYRLYFPDGEGVNLSMEGGRVRGFTRLRYPQQVACASSEERLLFGSDNGFVYELDRGTSFDGEPVEAFLRTAFHHLKSPQHKKRFFKVVLEAEGRASLRFAQDYSYGDEQINYSQALEIFSGGGFWDIDNWDEFIWGGPVVSSAEAYLEGSGLNMSITIASAGVYDEPHTIQGAILHYALRGIKR